MNLVLLRVAMERSCVSKRRARQGPLTSLWAFVAITFAAAPAFGAPTAGIVTSGAASIEQAGGTTTVKQSSDRASIDWQSFSVGKREIVNFDQPSASALTLNRVVGTEPSVIEGVLNANGQVFLINANGVLFAKGSQVNAIGLVASTLDISSADFQRGKYSFAGKSRSSVKNQGTLSTNGDGSIALLGKEVTNDGVIVATRGTVALASGERVTLNFRGTSLFSVTVDEGTLNALVENHQAISADGGKVFLTAKAADALLSAQVNNTGVIQARTLGDLAGTIDLHAYGGTAHIDGKLDASAPNGGNGGFVETSGDRVRVGDTAKITTFAPRGQTGTWLIDPDGFTLAASGGDMTGFTLSTQLANTDVEIQSTQGSGSDGDIHVDDPVLWSASTKLTLTATNDIHINRSITATGKGAGLELNFGGDYHILTRASFSGTEPGSDGRPVARKAPPGTQYAQITLKGENATLSINGDVYTLIHSMEQLAALDGEGGNFKGNVALAADLDAAEWSAIQDNATSGAVIDSFEGTFAGLGHTVSNLRFNVPQDWEKQRGAAFLRALHPHSTLRDLGVLNIDYVSGDGAGGLVSLMGGSTIRNCYATGKISVNTFGGGLAMGADNGDTGLTSQILSSFSDVDLTLGGAIQNGQVGGLLGFAEGFIIDRSHATGNVTWNRGSDQVDGGAGGLVGRVEATRGFELPNSITNSYATGDVQGPSLVGGLVGAVDGGAGSGVAPISISNSFATGNVTSSSEQTTGIGGLVGFASYGIVENTYATGNVNAGSGHNVGGLVGVANGSTISNSHASGNVYAARESENVTEGNGVGGLVGSAGYGTSIADSSASGSVTGNLGVGGLVGTLGSDSSVSHSSATGEVRGWRYVGGIAGANYGAIDDAQYSGKITGASNAYALVPGRQEDEFSDSIGGVAGYNEGAVSNSSSSGTITSGGAAGGIVGVNRPTYGVDSPAEVVDNHTDSVITADRAGLIVGVLDGGTVRGNTGNAEKAGVSNIFGERTVGDVVVEGNRALTGQQYTALFPDSSPPSTPNVSGGPNGNGDTEPSELSQQVAKAREDARIAKEAAESAASPAQNPQASSDTGAASGQDSSASQARAAQAASASQEGAAQTARVRRESDQAPSEYSEIGRTRNRPVDLGQNLVVPDRGRYSTSVQRIEIDGEVFELTTPSVPKKTAPKPKKK